MKAFTKEDFLALAGRIIPNSAADGSPFQRAIQFAALMAEQQSAADIRWDDASQWFNRPCGFDWNGSRCRGGIIHNPSGGVKCPGCDGTGRVPCASETT